MPRRYFHRSDSNQTEMVDALRNLGIRVHVWGEQADLICQFGGITVLAEVRPQDKPRQARKGRQERFQDEFMVYWLQTHADCLELARTLRRWQQLIVQAGAQMS
jgi:hypothetical protein